MPNTTVNYGLKKPTPEEFYDVEVPNENMDKIDVALKNLNDEVENIDVPVKSVNSKTGDVNLTAEDVGAETPQGSQQKANQAETNANNYTNQQINALPDPTWGNLQGKPTTFPPSAHNHPIGDITGLQTALNNLENSIGNLSSLSTSAKTNLVAAVNELKSQLGNVANLTTAEKSNIVASINEINQTLSEHLAERAKFVVATISSNQSIPNGTNINIDFDNVNNYNGADFLELESSSLKILKSGLYEVLIGVTFASNANGIRGITIVSQSDSSVNQSAIATSLTPTRMQCRFIGSLISNQILSPRVYQSSGGTLDITNVHCVVRKVSDAS